MVGFCALQGSLLAHEREELVLMLLCVRVCKAAVAASLCHK